MRIRPFITALRLGLLLAALPVTWCLAGKLTPPDATEAAIARLSAEMFSQMHYLHHPLDEEMSKKFYDQYLKALDGYHLHFLQSDLDEFAPYRTKLDAMTLKDGDTSLARLVFSRFLERFEQRINYTTNLILTGTFDFTGHDLYTLDRRKAQNPKTLAEAQELWRQELRYEYLQEKLAAHDIQFTGPVSANDQGENRISLVKDKTHPLVFTVLPQKFYTQNHHLLGTLQVDLNQTNAVISLAGHDWKKKTKQTQDIYSETGEKLGSLTLRYSTNGFADNFTANTPAISGASVTLDHTNGPGIWANDPKVALGTNSPAPVQSKIDSNALSLDQPPSRIASPVTEKPATPAAHNWVALIQLNQKNMADVVKNLTNRYVRLQKNFRDFTGEKVAEYYLNSLARAYDPHSDYMGHDQSEDFNIQMKLSLVGIGAKLTTEDNYCKIDSLLPGPAQKSGKIKANDRIVAVAQGTNEPVDVIGMLLPKVVNLIRGVKGTEVRLTIIPHDAQDSSVRVVVPLIRAEIQLEDQRAKAPIFEIPGDKGNILRLGVIDLPSFYADKDGNKKPEERKSTTGDVARLLQRLKKEHVDGVILDLRQNGGGFLDEAISLTGLFIKSGPVVQTKDSDGYIDVESSHEPSPLYDGPLVVLTSRFSASASEILAGALQDYGRALIVGDRATYGKGTVQTMLGLTPYLAQRGFTPAYDPGDIKITIKKFYRAGGSSTQNKGVIPDVELPSKNSYAEVGEEVMDNALEWDTVTSANPTNLFRVKPFLPELKSRSARRIQTDKDLVYWNEDVQRYKKMVEEKSVSMNEADRLEENNRDKARLEARKKERASRKKSAEKEYEITFKNIDDPVLHPPEVKTNETASASIETIGLDEDGELADAKAPEPDVILLDETKRILADYISLLKKDQAISKAH